MALGGVNTSPCLIPARLRRIAQPVRSYAHRNSTYRPGRTRRRTYSSQLRRCETIPSMRALSFGTNKNWHMRKRSSPRSKGRVFGMDDSTTTKLTRIEQCQANAKARSEQKRQAALSALAQLQREKRAITKAAVALQAGVSLVFLRSHPDLVQAIEDAARTRVDMASPALPGTSAKDQVIAALRRRLDEMKQQLTAKDRE